MAKRRKMVADCKGMRAQIFEFEQEWTRKHNRIPKTYERGAMQTVYAKYRELKKDIRNLAAVDLQRTARGFIARCRLRDPAARHSKPSWAGHGSHNTNVSSSKGSHTHHKSVDDLVTATNSLHHQPLSHFAESHKAAAASLQQHHAHQPQLNTSSSGSAGHVEGTVLGDLYGRYRELLNNKRELKRKLKKFDEDFVEQWGRLPKKADKEVIRPMYQKYHEVKSSLDDLKAQIEQSHGPLPDDLLEDKHGSSQSGSRSGAGDVDGESDAMDGKLFFSDEVCRLKKILVSNSSKQSRGSGNSAKYLSSDDDDSKPLSAHRA